MVVLNLDKKLNVDSKEHFPLLGEYRKEVVDYH
jgi:hypothetical protein